jgi:hypothetical protein
VPLSYSLKSCLRASFAGEGHLFAHILTRFDTKNGDKKY